MILFINGCVRENSRTLELAEAVLSQLSGEIQEVSLFQDGAESLDTQSLCLRDRLLQAADYSHPMFDRAKQFAQADTVVIAAPYWNLLFPARVLAYLEEIAVPGLTFQYGENEFPHSLCKATRLIYITTAGSRMVHPLGFEYARTSMEFFYGVHDVRLIKAEGLDLLGADPKAILEKAKAEIPFILK